MIEGQGALFHPAYAGVTLGLIHGSQPDALVLCHDPSRTHVNMYPDYPLPSLGVAIQRYLECAQLTNASVRMVGVSLNTSMLDDECAHDLMAAVAGETGLPTIDPIRTGCEALVDQLLAPSC